MKADRRQKCRMLMSYIYFFTMREVLHGLPVVRCTEE
jgi:hypothetical protein